MGLKTAFRYTSEPDLSGYGQRVPAAEKAMLDTQRDGLRFHGRRFVSLAFDEAPKDSGDFASEIRFRTFQRGRTLGFTASTPQPLGKFILEGTKAHPITPKGPGYPLRFFWQNGPRGAGIYHYFSVWHPGTKPNRFIGRALFRWLPGARVLLREISQSYTRVIMGGIRGTRTLPT